MEEISKRIEIKNGEITYSNRKSDKEDTKSLFYTVLDENKETAKRMYFSIWDEMSFSAWQKGSLDDVLELKQIDFKIEKSNPLFKIFNRFLNGENSFTLDEEINEKYKKTMKIYKADDSINVLFENNSDRNNRNDLFDVFKVSVKDTDFDCQKRTLELFKDIELELLPKEKLESFLIPKAIKFSAENVEAEKETIYKIIPELKDEDGFDQKNPWHVYDVWTHTLKALEKSMPDLEIRLALLLHDIGKPHSYQEYGKIRHFRGHSEKSAEISKGILERLGYSKDKIDNILYLIKNHSTSINVDKVDKDNLEINKKLLNVQYCDACAYNPKYVEKVLFDLNMIGEQLILKEREYKKELLR